MSKLKFKPFNTKYWTGIYTQLNPFMGVPECPICKSYAHLEQAHEDIHGGAVTVYTFHCKKCDQPFEWRMVND